MVEQIYTVDDLSEDLLGLEKWPQLVGGARGNPADYVPSSDLAAAVNVAISLGKPLLLTGEPGTGKTDLSEHILFKLKKFKNFDFFDRVLRFDVRSNSVAKELMYEFDTLRRFGDYQISDKEAKRPDIEDYISFNALGIALMLTTPAHPLFGRLPAEYKADVATPRRSVVLIDEIDKAPRDFPNDMLNELDRFQFEISELRAQSRAYSSVAANKELRPIVVITSNSEKHLPDAFLRRCIFFHIEFPTDEELLRIAELRTSHRDTVDRDLLKVAMRFFFQLREKPPGPQKKPGTAEFLEWLDVLCDNYAGQKGEDVFAQSNRTALSTSLTVLCKSKDDLERAVALLNGFDETETSAATE